MHISSGFFGEQEVIIPQAVIDLMQQDVITQTLYIKAIGFYPNAEGHFREREVGLNDYILLYCINGRGWFELDGVRYTINAMEYVILPRNKPHKYGADESQPWSIYWVHFAGTFAEHYVGVCGATVRLDSANNNNYNRNTIFQNLIQALHNSNYEITGLRYATAAFQFYLASMRYVGYFGATIPATNTDDIDYKQRICERAIHFMKENVNRRISINEIAQYVGYSPSRFSTLFSEVKQQSALSFYTQLKCAEAANLLLNTKLKANQISEQLAFSDPLYFSRIFKQYYGLSPQHYRKNAGNIQNKNM